MKYYHVIIEKNHHWSVPNMDTTRQEIICKGRVRCPEGWHIGGVCGYHEEPKKREGRAPEDLPDFTSPEAFFCEPD